MEELYIQMLGEFCITSSRGKLTWEALRSDQMLRLLTYLLINRDRSVSVEELSDVLWSEKETANPAGAIKNLMYRLRTSLKALGEDSYILTGRGAYSWNREIPVRVDFEEFERLCTEALHIKEEGGDCCEVCEEALSLYRGSFPDKLAHEHWLLPLEAYYHSLYLETVKLLAEDLEKKKDYEKMEEICGNALRLDSLDEQLHYFMVRALMGNGRYDQALRHCEQASKAIRQSLGIRNLEKLGSLYEILLEQGGRQFTNLEDICESISEDKPVGLYLCSYSVFREIYRLEARRIGRMGISEYVMLLTVYIQDSYRKNSGVIRLYLSKAMDLLERILRTSLRIGDVAACYSECQYIVMLPGCTYETAELVAERIERKFRESLGEQVAGIHYELEEVTPEARFLGKGGGG